MYTNWKGWKEKSLYHCLSLQNLRCEYDIFNQWLDCFFKRSILNLALSVFFFFLKEEPFHFSCTIHVIISRLSEHFAMIFSTESLGEWLISIVIYHWHQSNTRSDSKEVVLQAALLYKLAGFRKDYFPFHQSLIVLASHSMNQSHYWWLLNLLQQNCKINLCPFLQRKWIRF